MTRQRGGWRAAAGLLLLLGTTACGGGREVTDGPRAGGEAGPSRGGTLVAGMIADMESINVYAVPSNAVTQEVVSLLYLRLVEERPDSQQHPPTIKPALAERWELSPDRRSLTFHLREDATWSDGVPVTAEDVRFSWQAQTHPDVLWDSAYFKEGITDVEVLDPHTVRFHFNRVSAQELLNVNEGEIIPKHAWSRLPFEEWRQRSDWFMEAPVVSGPYTLESWTPQQEIVLRRNERFHQEGKPYIDRIIMRVVADRSTLMTQALTGELDHVFGITLSDAERVEAAPNLRLISFWGRGTVFIAWNLTHPLFAETPVRQALTLAMDRQRIVDTIYGSWGRLAVSPVISDYWAFNQEIEPWPYDPDRAREILEAQGWVDRDGDGIREKDGRPFSFELATNTGNQQRLDAAVMIQEQLRQVGVEARVRTMAFNPLMARATRHEFEAILMKWSMPTDLDLSFAFHTEAIGRADNVFSYSNPEVDRLLEAAKTVSEMEAMRPYLDPIQEIIHRDQPMTFLWESKDLGVASRRLHFGDEPPNILRRFWHAWEWWLEPR